MANNCKSFFAGVLIGGIVGAAVALLTAPKAGPEMRKELEKGLEVAKGKGKKLYTSVLTQASGAGLGKEKVMESDGTGRWMELPIHRETRKTKKDAPIVLTGTTLSMNEAAMSIQDTSSSKEKPTLPEETKE